MKTCYTSDHLRMDILALEAKSRRQEEDLKNTAAAAIDSLKPANLIKNTFNSTFRSPAAGKNLLKGALGLAAGFLSKKLFVMGSSNIVKKALGTVVELGVAKVVANNADKITSSGIKIINKVIR